MHWTLRVDRTRHVYWSAGAWVLRSDGEFGSGRTDAADHAFVVDNQTDCASWSHNAIAIRADPLLHATTGCTVSAPVTQLRQRQREITARVCCDHRLFFLA